MSTILVGVDGSERSEDAIAFTRAIAERFDADVVVASSFPYEPLGRAANVEFRHALEQDAEAVAVRMAAGLDDLDPGRVSIRTVANTSPAHALYELAESIGADLVVVGSSHTGRLGRVLPGSTAERLLHGAPCPVAVVPHGYRKGTPELRRIGVAYNGSREADAALQIADALARASGASLEVIRSQPVLADIAPVATAGMYAELNRNVAEDSRTVLEQAVEDLGSEAMAVFREGDPVEVLAERSAELDLLVTGSRRYGPLRSVLLGGVTGPLMRMAACPVLVIPRGIEVALGELLAEGDTAR